MSDKRNALRTVREHIRNGKAPEALAGLRLVAGSDDPFAMQSLYAATGKALAPLLADFPEIRIAFLSDATLNHWVEALRFWLLLEGFILESYIAPFNSWRQEGLDTASGLYGFKPDLVWFFVGADSLGLRAANGSDKEEGDRVTRAAVEELAGIAARVAEQSGAMPIVNNIVPLETRVFGNYEGMATWSASTLIRQFNLMLPETLPQGSVVFDLDYLAACHGLKRWHDSRLWHHSKHPFALDAIGPTAFAAARLVAASRGKAKKCVALDLDDTLWGGVIGDDGVNGIRIGDSGGGEGEAYRHFQLYLKELAMRGVLLAVCSKNDPEIAKEPFLSRPEMALGLSDFSAFRANWNNKADNLREIAEELNLGTDSFVFVDDNPAERDLVRRMLPEVAVIELPRDPAGFVPALDAGKWFECIAFSKEDRTRSQSYRAETARSALRETAGDLTSYLKSLEMRAEWGKVDAQRLARVAQLFNKTNQFNLTGRKHSEAELRHMLEGNDSAVIWFSLCDKFGDYGVIAAAIVCFTDNTAVITDWVMSCRVFSRGMEEFTWDKLRRLVRERHCTQLVGCYRPTAKNAVVADVLRRFGGEEISPEGDMQRWRFGLECDTLIGLSTIDG